MSYKVKLEIFEGPLDLLLYLIKRDELDIYDIPIARISEEYLQYLDLMKLLDLGIAGEFLVMASSLMQIKSRLLLPAAEQPEEEEEIDPRAELVQRLIEYQKFKEAAQALANREEEHRQVFVRGSKVIRPVEEDEDKEYFEASLFDLISAFSRALDKVPRELFYEIIKDEVTVEEKIHDILHWLLTKSRLLLSELFARAKNKLDIIVTFLAILELIRLKEIIACQKKTFGEIELIRNIESAKPIKKK